MSRAITIIWGLLSVFSYIGEHATCESEISMGEIMLSQQNYSSGVGELLSEEDYDATVAFYLYTRSTSQSLRQRILINGKTKLNETDFDATKNTLVVIHGFMSDVDTSSVQDIKNAALEFYDVNVIGVDWNYFTMNSNYAWVASMVDEVGKQVAKLIQYLMDHGLSNSNIHLIGHSLGAHVAGFAGKELQANGQAVGRITGLDPAYPAFFDIYDTSTRLASTDAYFVDCIHTCGGKLGYADPICQADFYPNGGIDPQPSCSLLDFGACSHGRAHEYFAESINPSHLFNAQTCKGIIAMIPYFCEDEGALMGYPASPWYKGPHSLSTNSQSPFAKNITAG